MGSLRLRARLKGRLSAEPFHAASLAKRAKCGGALRPYALSVHPSACVSHMRRLIVYFVLKMVLYLDAAWAREYYINNGNDVVPNKSTMDHGKCAKGEVMHLIVVNIPAAGDRALDVNK